MTTTPTFTDEQLRKAIEAAAHDRNGISINIGRDGTYLTGVELSDLRAIAEQLGLNDWEPASSTHCFKEGDDVRVERSNGLVEEFTVGYVGSISLGRKQDGGSHWFDSSFKYFRRPAPRRLPDTVGATIKNVKTRAGNEYNIMIRDGDGDWAGIARTGINTTHVEYVGPLSIVEWEDDKEDN